MPGTRWLTFDCYGTIADWNACMLGALAAGRGRARGEPLLAAYHRAESILEARPHWRPYREVLTDGLGLAARRVGVPLADEQAGAFVAAWPSMPVFPDVAEALGTLASFGWRLAILTNCDDDLFAATSARLPVPFEVVVTAEQVRSYKPDLGHFRKFAEMTGATPANWIHVANSWVHDIAAGRPDGAALGLGRPRPHGAPGQVRRAPGHHDAPPAGDGGRRERAARLAAFPDPCWPSWRVGAGVADR